MNIKEFIYDRSADEYVMLSAVLLVIVILAFWRVNYVQRRRNELEAEYQNLLVNQALLEVEHLKFQIQPHTLKNILAGLKAVAGKLKRGMDSLSDTLDYILYHGNENLVPICEEEKFIEDYIGLNEILISNRDSIKLKKNIDEDSKYYTEPAIPHLITAHFVENAFKHGDVSHPEFLQIDIQLSSNQFELVIVNRIRRKTQLSEPGIGLQNVKKRLELLGMGSFDISNSCNEEIYKSRLTIQFNESESQGGNS